MVKTNPQTPRKCLSVAEKIRFGIPGSHRTEPNNTEPKLRYSVNLVRFGPPLLACILVI